MNLLKTFVVSAVAVFALIGCEKETTVTPDYTLKVPNGGETYKVGDVVPVSWLQSSNVVGTLVKISVNGGKSWNQVVDRTSQVPKDSTSYNWVILADDLQGKTPPVQALLKISNYTDETIMDVSNNPFTITE